MVKTLKNGVKMYLKWQNWERDEEKMSLLGEAWKNREMKKMSRMTRTIRGDREGGGGA